MSPERQSETCSMVLVVLGCVQAHFWVPFTCPWIGRPGSLGKKASANVRECLGLSRRLLKCARRCHRSFWYQGGFLKSHIGYLLTLRPCSHVRAFTPNCRVMISNPSFGRESFVGAGGPKWGAESLDSRTNPFEERGNDEDREHDNEADAHELGSRIREEGADAQDLGDLHVPSWPITRAKSRQIQQAMESLLMGFLGQEESNSIRPPRGFIQLTCLEIVDSPPKIGLDA
ncbi:hypothetical protein CRG98_009349 [Punica granatum]|uniref:Uncharacterized protein n=1 Tax=Punica granatum TaxID=22663 RepID=A0A2I0KP69_PUNGR|nr:hypothetical protein CRG98_009349 [Punica granatum]